MNEQKGQVTLFVIIGIVLLVVILLAIFALSGKKENTIPDKILEDPDTVEYYVQSCLKTSVKKVTDEFGLMGMKGYPEFDAVDKYVFINPTDRVNVDVDFATYYFLNGQKYFPTLEESELRYSQLLERELESCVGDFEAFSEQGIVVEHGIMIARGSFNKNDVTATVEWPLTITDGENVFERDKFFYKLDYSLKDKYDILSEYVSYQENDLEFFQIGNIVELSQIYGFDYQIQSLTDGSVLVNLIFNDYEEIQNKPYDVVFVIK